jgi:hypothetical protein
MDEKDKIIRVTFAPCVRVWIETLIMFVKSIGAKRKNF